MQTKISKFFHMLSQKKNSLLSKIKLWKENIHKKNIHRFPIPNMEISTKHLTADNTNNILGSSNISTKKMLKFWLLGLCVVILGYMMYISLDYLYMVIAAFIISLSLEGCIVFWQRLTKSRGLGITITYIIATIFVLSGFIILIPFFFNRGHAILQSIMNWLLGIESSIIDLGIAGYINQLNWIPDFFKNEIITWIENGNADDILNIINDNIGNIMSKSSEYVKIIAGQTLNLFGNIFSIIADFAIILTLCVFFSVAHYNIKYTLKYLCRHFKSGWERIDSAYSGIAIWLKKQLFLCVFIGIASYLGLWILERCGISIPQKGTLALIAGLLEIIPYIGPRLGALPAAVSALIFSGGWGLLAVVIVYTIIQQGEEKFLVPVMMGKSLGVSPVLVFICIIFCGCIMGVLGMLLAVPIAVIISLAFHIPQPNEIEGNNSELVDDSKVVKKKVSKSK